MIAGLLILAEHSTVNTNAHCGFLIQVMEIKALQEQLAAAEAALKRERDRADLLASELQHLRQRVSYGAASPAALPSSPSSIQTSATLIPDPTSASEPDMVLVSRATLEMLYLKERAMDAVKEGITIADAQAPDMPLVYVNEGFSRLTGYPFETFSLGKSCRFLQGPGTEESVVRQLSLAIKAGQACVVQITNYKRNGNPFLNYLSLTPVHDVNGTVTHYVGIQADITELVVRRQAELAAKHAAVEAAAATEAKSQFLARMSHEIRTPLNGMIAVGQLLADTRLTPAQWDLVNTIRCSGEALLTLITDILDFSKIEANKMVLSSVPFSLESTIEAAMEIAGLHAARKRLQAAYHIAPGVPQWVVGDAQRLQQVLLNILNNALKFTESGEVLLEVWAQLVSRPSSRAASGELAASTSAGPSKTDKYGAAAAPMTTINESSLYEIHFSVRDTGIGISKSDLVRLFQSFSQVDASPTRRFGGSGLGLAISQKLSEAMGGRMWAESSGLGHGSAFRWCIRTSEASDGDITAAKTSQGGLWGRAPAAIQADEASKLLRGKKILLVEPCEMVRQVMLLALGQWGCAVCAVESERAAVAKLHLLPGQHPTTPAPLSNRPGGKSRLSLAHAGGEGLRNALAASAACCGPFDVVILDSAHSSVLHALMECCVPDEAQRVVFLGWPGENNPEEEQEITAQRAAAASAAGGGSTATAPAVGLPHLPNVAFTPASSAAPIGSLPKEAAPPAYASGTLNLPAVALPPKAMTAAAAAAAATGLESRSTSSGDLGRQLGYVVVSRPVRQGRLRLGLLEVLEMQLEPPEETSASTSRGFDASKSTVEVPTSPSGNCISSNGLVNDPSQQHNHHSPLSHGPSTAALSDLATHLDARSDGGRSEVSPSEGTTAASSMYRSLGSMGSLLQAAPMKRVSSGSSLTTTDGALHGNGTQGNATRRLLLAEDNAINMKVALGILRRLGFTNVVTAPDGVAAVEAVAAAGGPAAFDAILMDLHMPKKGGIEAVQDILRAWPNQKTKIIAVTADAFEDTRDTCVANGFTGWLAKPFRVEEFAQIMGHL